MFPWSLHGVLGLMGSLGLCLVLGVPRCSVMICSCFVLGCSLEAFIACVFIVAVGFALAALLTLMSPPYFLRALGWEASPARDISSGRVASQCVGLAPETRMCRTQAPVSGTPMSRIRIRLIVCPRSLSGYP